jgi:signal transduction histidine kinase
VAMGQTTEYEQPSRCPSGISCVLGGPMHDHLAVSSRCDSRSEDPLSVDPPPATRNAEHLSAAQVPPSAGLDQHSKVDRATPVQVTYSASQRPFVDNLGPHRASSSDGLRVRQAFLAAIGLLLFSLLFAWHFSQNPGLLPISVLVFWLPIYMAVDLLPIRLPSGVTFSMDSSVNIALVVIFRTEPWVPMLISFVGVVDPRLFKKEILFRRDLFNRAQIGVSVGVCGWVANTVWQLNPGQRAPGLIVAAVSFSLCNIGFVWLAIKLHTGMSARDSLGSLFPRPRMNFAVFYPAFLVLGIAIAEIYLRVGYGWWLAAIILIPLFIGRFALVFAEKQAVLAGRVRDQKTALWSMTEKLFMEREQERERIAQQIHDSSLQYLAGAALALRQARHRLGLRPTDPTADTLDTVDAGLHRGIEELRDSLSSLRHATMNDGLVDSVKKFLHEITWLWRVRVASDCAVLEEPPRAVALTCFLIIQEAVSNAAQHSGSSDIMVELTQRDDGFTVLVQDSGQGFPDDIVNANDHFGLELMTRRASEAGGELTIESLRGIGTTVTAFIPLESKS